MLGKTSNKTGEYAGKKAGDEIFDLLRKKNTMPTIQEEPSPVTEPSPMTDYEMSERLLNQILSGGKLRKMKLI